MKSFVVVSLAGSGSFMLRAGAMGDDIPRSRPYFAGLFGTAGGDVGCTMRCNSLQFAS